MDRIFLVVLDSVGIGAMPDAARYGDAGANTLGNLARALGGLCLPNLGALGLGNLLELPGVPPVGSAARAAYGRMALAAAGKDTLTGHWEMVGLPLDEPFRTYPEGFDAELIAAFTTRAGLGGVLGNKAASGTAIIAELGEAHVQTGWPIVYTSADSVFQIAAHEAVMPVAELYRICRVARELLVGRHKVGRVIARPFTGSPGAFVRTAGRRDFPLEPPQPMLLDYVAAAGLEVVAIGKIADIFAGRGITRAVKTAANAEGLDALADLQTEPGRGLVMANLVDFDMIYGHRRDAPGYAAALAEVDARLPGLLAGLGPSEALVLTADHGNDPTFKGTDHTREYVPLLIAGDGVRAGTDLGLRPTLADLGATVADLLGVSYGGRGASFAADLRR